MVKEGKEVITDGEAGYNDVRVEDSTLSTREKDDFQVKLILRWRSCAAWVE